MKTAWRAVVSVLLITLGVMIHNAVLIVVTSPHPTARDEEIFTWTTGAAYVIVPLCGIAFLALGIAWRRQK